MSSLIYTLKKSIPEKYYPHVEWIYFNFRSLLYLGNKLTCPCCKGHFRKFVTFKSRPNARCPRCGAFERHRLLYLYLKDRTNFFKKNLKVLDIAPTQFFQKTCRSLSNIDYVSADISSPLAMLQMDITKIQLPDDQFDCIFCFHVLEHVQDDQTAMAELFRILKPGGWALLQSPVDMNRDITFEDPNIVTAEDRHRIYGHAGHVRSYGRDYRDRLENAGFIVKVDDYIQRLDASVIIKYGLMEKEDIYFCTKPNIKRQ